MLGFACQSRVQLSAQTGGPASQLLSQKALQAGDDGAGQSLATEHVFEQKVPSCVAQPSVRQVKPLTHGASPVLHPSPNGDPEEQALTSAARTRAASHVFI